jgi:hypothetical protein
MPRLSRFVASATPWPTSRKPRWRPSSEPRSAAEQPEYLRARAISGDVAAHYDRARDSYRQLARVQPLELDVTLNYARVCAWAGDTNNAVSEYRKYLAGRPTPLTSGWNLRARNRGAATTPRRWMRCRRIANASASRPRISARWRA